MGRILIGYDIHDGKRRRRVCASLRKLTACYQKSFFDCQLSPAAGQALFQLLASQLIAEEDGLIFAWINPDHSYAIGHRWTDSGASLYLVN